jgi:putative addiction module component (TIGR02574 family)
MVLKVIREDLDMTLKPRQKIFDLPKNEKILLVQDLLESLKDEERLSDEIKALLDERIADDRKNRDKAIPWEQLKKQLRARRRKK